MAIDYTKRRILRIIPIDNLEVYLKRKGGYAPHHEPSDGLELEEVMEGGSVGFWLDEQIFADADPVNTLRNYHSLVHIPMESSIGGEV